MIVYHGTTIQRARRICREGLLPKPPSGRVWFAEDRRYAYHRAGAWARRTRDLPIVLTADVDVAALRNELGRGRVMHRNAIIAIAGAVPVSMLRWDPEINLSATPAEVAEWLNEILGARRPRRIGRHHPGVARLARWIDHQVGSGHRSEVRWSEIHEMAVKWLPEHFIGMQVDMRRVRDAPLVGTVHVEIDRRRPRQDPRADEAIALLKATGVKARVRGLRLLAEIQDPHLFDWCTLFLGDESVTVQLAALEAMLSCEDLHPDVLEPLASSDNKRIRGAALAALTVHGGTHGPRWLARGLKDPCPCVRIAVARHLSRLDPATHEALFELALTDPNPDVVRFARKLAAGQPYAKAL